MGRKRQGTIDREPSGALYARLTVTTAEGAKRIRAKLDSSFTDAEALSIAQDMAAGCEGRILSAHELALLKSEDAAGKVRDVRGFFRGVYHPTRERKASARSEESWWRIWILPELGAEDVKRFDARPLRQLVRNLDLAIEEGRLASGTAGTIWAQARRFCSDLESSKDPAIRIRRDNPARGVRGPDRTKGTAKQWLYPRELRQLLASPTTPLDLAELFAAQVYLCARPGEVLALRWDRVDLDNGSLRIDATAHLESCKIKEGTKTGETRVLPVPAVLLPMLRRMRERQENRGRLFVRAQRSSQLRALLLKAGITRPELHDRSPRSAPLRRHDLRATGISYLALDGCSDEGIRERAGHADFSQTLAYIRRGKLVAGSIGDPFAPLPDRLISSGDTVREAPGALEIKPGAVSLRRGKARFSHPVYTARTKHAGVLGRIPLRSDTIPAAILVLPSGRVLNCSPWRRTTALSGTRVQSTMSAPKSWQVAP